MTQSSSPICITDKNYDNDTYLYDLLMLCRNNFEEENNIWINYPEKNNQFSFEQWWIMIKNSLAGFKIMLKTIFRPQ